MNVEKAANVSKDKKKWKKVLKGDLCPDVGLPLLLCPVVGLPQKENGV
jgi:hypothetical protein